MTVFNELKRRNVIRVGIAYVVSAWLLLQVANMVLNNFELPGWVFHTTLLILAIELPVALLLAWAFELTPEGIRKEKEVDRSQSITHSTGRRMDRHIIIALTLGEDGLGFESNRKVSKSEVRFLAMFRKSKMIFTIKIYENLRQKLS